MKINSFFFILGFVALTSPLRADEIQKDSGGQPILECRGPSRWNWAQFEMLIGREEGVKMKNKITPLFIDTNTISKYGNNEKPWRHWVHCEGDLNQEIICADDYPRYRIQKKGTKWSVEQSYISFPEKTGTDEFFVTWEMIGHDLVCGDHTKVDLRGQDKPQGPYRR